MRTINPDVILLAKTIGGHIKTQREALNEDIHTTAKKVKMNPQHLERIEEGQVNLQITTVMSLANYFEIAPHTLFIAAEHG